MKRERSKKLNKQSTGALIVLEKINDNEMKKNVKKPEPLTDTQILKRLTKEMRKSSVFNTTNFKT